MSDDRKHAMELNDRGFAAWNARDPDGVASVFAQDAVMREAGGEVRGRAAVRERAAALFVGLPDFRMERIQLLVDGDHLADRWLITGTHRGELFGMPPTGRRIRLEGASFTRLGRDGLVAEEIHFYDASNLLAQLSA
jgi:steroid delta-isomerase-like uncharacterized protein